MYHGSQELEVSVMHKWRKPLGKTLMPLFVLAVLGPVLVFILIYLLSDIKTVNLGVLIPLFIVIFLTLLLFYLRYKEVWHYIDIRFDGRDLDVVGRIAGALTRQDIPFISRTEFPSSFPTPHWKMYQEVYQLPRHDLKIAVKDHGNYALVRLGPVTEDNGAVIDRFKALIDEAMRG